MLDLHSGKGEENSCIVPPFHIAEVLFVLSSLLLSSSLSSSTRKRSSLTATFLTSRGHTCHPFSPYVCVDDRWHGHRRKRTEAPRFWGIE